MHPDPFETLGLPRRYDTDPGAVRTAWLRRSAELHPDRVGAGLDDAEIARRSAEMNDARRVLLDDELRARALLELLTGRPLDENAKPAPDLLMEFLEVREGLEDAKAQGDEEAVERFRQWAQQRGFEHRDKVAALFAHHGSDLPLEIAATIRAELHAWRYARRMLEQVETQERTGHTL